MNKSVAERELYNKIKADSQISKILTELQIDDNLLFENIIYLVEEIFNLILSTLKNLNEFIMLLYFYILQAIFIYSFLIK
jgi:ABC-type proline/glycine betaine transport system permease subunit